MAKILLKSLPTICILSIKTSSGSLESKEILSSNFLSFNLHDFTNESIKNYNRFIVVKGTRNDPNKLVKSFHPGKGRGRVGGMKLSKLAELVACLRRTNSINSKIEILKTEKELMPLLDCIYDPNYKFHVRSTALKGKLLTEKAVPFDSIEELLKALHERRITGNTAVASVDQFIANNAQHSELIKAIIDKNLKARIGHELIKRAVGEDPAGDEKIKCALGYSLNQPRIESFLKKSLAEGEEWFLSRKFDGIRAFLKHESGSFSFLSRRKIPIAGLNPTINETLTKLPKNLKENFVLDGELVVVDPESGRDDFSLTVSTVKSLEAKPIGSLKFYAFDVVEREDSLFVQRQMKVQKLIFNLNSDFIKLVPQKRLHDFDKDALIKQAADSGFEGFILRRNSFLSDGRNRDLLKLKPFEDAEFSVVGREIGPMRIIFDGAERVEQVLLSLTVDVKGFSVKVGSGFSVDERRVLASIPEAELIGSLVTIRYQSESKAKNREQSSLRFPVFKHFHGKSRTE